MIANRKTCWNSTRLSKTTSTLSLLPHPLHHSAEALQQTKSSIINTGQRKLHAPGQKERIEAEGFQRVVVWTGSRRRKLNDSTVGLDLGLLRVDDLGWWLFGIMNHDFKTVTTKV